MVKYVGLNKQEQLKKLQDDAQNQVENILKSFDDNLEALTRKNTFGENALGVVLFTPSLLYRATKGAFDGVLNAAHSIYLIGANLVNDVGHIFKAEDVHDGIAKTQYAMGNLIASFFEGVGSMLIDTASLAARTSMANVVTGGGIGDLVDDKLYGKDGVASTLAEEANAFRASILKQSGTRKMAELILGEDKKEDIDEVLGNMDKQYEGMTDEEIVNSRYSDSFKEHIQGSLDVKNWIKDNITDKYLANINTLGIGSTADAYTQNLWGDSKVYETLVGSSESIGNILVSWALAKVAKQKFGMSAEGAKMLSSAYFAANVFAGSFEEAINNGADMQDAYTYAASNAFMETMLENIGGYDTSGASSSNTSFYEKFIKNEKWANIVSNMVEEGTEEVGSVILGRSMSQYGNPDGTIEEQSIKDFASEAMFSFIGGALSSMVLGFGQNAYINTTANSKANQVVQTFDKKVYDLGAEKAVKIFKKDLNTFVETLNKKNAKGLKTNARGAEFIGKLDTKEKIKLVRTAGLQNVVLLNEETGNFELNPEVERMDENFFKNTSHGQTIDNSEYAISKGVVKTDISDDGNYNVLKISEMNEKEKTIYDFVKDSKSSIALVRGNVGTGTNAFHVGKNGVIYLNTELLENMPKKEIQEKIIRHEFVHHIKTVAPDMYDDLAGEMEKLIDLELNEETNTLDITYKSEKAKRVLEPILKKAKFTTTLMHNFNTHHADVSKNMLTAEQLKQVDAIVNGSNVQGEVERQKLYNSEVQKMLTEEQKKSAFNQSVEVLSEEMLAYFIENTIQGGKFVDLISKDKTLFEKIKNIFSKETDYIYQISGDNKDIEAGLKRMRTKFDKATERILKAENTLYHLTYHLFDDVKTAVLKHLDKELVAKYGVDEIMLAISETYDSDTGTIIINGTTYKDTDVFVDMKDHTVRKHTQAPSDDEVRSKFTYDKRKHDVYAKELKNLIKDAQLNLKGLLINPKLNQNAIFELENMIETAKDILTTFKDGADLFEDEIKFIADLMLNVETEKGTEKGKGKPKSKPTIAATVNSNLIQKFVYRIKKSTSYKDIKNRAYNANINGAQLFYEHTKKDAKGIQEETENVITTMSIALNTAGFQGQYFIKHFNRGNITEFIIESDDAYVDELVKKALDRIQNEEEKEKDTRSQTEIRREENNAYLNNEIDKMISFLGNDSNNVIRIDPKTTVEDIQAMKFNKDNLIVGMPAFGGKMETNILNAALKVAPTVAIVMPITYKGSYANQNQVNKNAKLIYNEISPPLLVPTKTNKNKNSLHKVVSQVWTTADTFQPDLRLKANRPFVHNDFDSFIVNTKAQFEAYKNASDKGNFDFDFAIPFRATDINDFNKKIKSFDDMNPTTKYLIIKAKNKNALNIFNLINFTKLAETGGNVLLGFTTADLVEAYSDIAKKVKKGDIRYSKNLTQLTPEEERNIINTFGDANLKSLFVKDAKTGAFKLKSNLIKQTKRSNKVKINGAIYGANKYAINAYHNFENHNIKVKANGYKAPVEIDKLSAEHRIMYDILSTSRLSFVMYDSGNVRTNAIGFSLTKEKANVVFLNVKYLSGGNFVDTLIHEHIHEAFKAKTMDAIAYGKGLIDLLFDTSDGTVKTTAVFDAINSKYSQYGGDFYSYFTAYTRKTGYVKIRNHKEFYNLLSSNVQPDTKEYRTLNEITAQFYGTLFSDTKAVRIALQGKNSNNIMLYNIFSNLLNDSNTPQTIKTFLQNSLQGISKLFKNYLQKIENMFPSNRAYTLAELNKFIKEFSSGEFKTRKSLIDAYIKEKAQNTRGKASVVIDNVLYIAAQFEKVIQSGTQAFTQLQEEFSNFKNDVELLLTNENALLNLTGTDMPKKIKELTDLIKEMQVIQKGTGDAFTNFAMVEALRELVYDLNDLYNSYDDDAIRILGFPNRKTLTVFAQSVINELDDLLNYLSNNTTYPDIGKYIKKVLSNLDNFIDILKGVNTALKSNKGLFGQITKLQKSYRESRIKNLLSTITTRVNNYMNHLLNNNTLQKRSPVNDDLKAISALYGKMVNVIKDNQFNFNNMRDELIPILAELKTMIELSERVPDDLKQNLITHVYNLAKNFTGLTKDTTFMLSLFPNDKNFINLSASEFTKNYSESSIVKSLKEIIKAFETVYTSSFGNDQYTHDEYSRKTINQIRNIKKAMKSELRGMRLEKLAYLKTPQDYYALFKDTFPEVDFFKDMYDAYIEAAIRKDNITAQFGDAYRDFKKKNDKLHDYSLEEIDVSGIFQMRKSDIDIILKEVQDEIEKLQDLVSASSAVISKLKGEKKLIRQAIEEKQILIANALPRSAEKARLEKELVKLQKDLNAKNAEIKKAEADKKANEAKRDTYNRDVVFQERFHELMGERYPDYNTGQPMKLRRGTVISLYMSIVRELEMKEMHQNGGDLAPTNHLNYLSQFYSIDNEIIKTKGWQYAKDNAAPYVILEKDIIKFKDSLEALLSDEESRIIIEFARERFDWNYESTDEIFFAKHKTHLPKQPSYFPFRTIQSDNKRDIELKNAKAYNVGVATGFVKATTEGASTPLLIENVFDVIEKHSGMVANYSFDRFIYDFENLRVNKSSGTTFQNEITGKGSKLGTGHGFEKFFETTMQNILNYKDKKETKRIRATKKVLHATVSATMALNIPSTIKQLASIYTISRKNGLPLGSMLQNVLVSLTGGNKRLRDWLMKNNGNFNLRAQYNNIPALSLHVTPDFTYRVDGAKKKIVDFLSAPVGWFDNAVLVGAFKTIYDQEKLANPAATEDEILKLADKRFYDVLIFGVANTSAAFRSAFSNDDRVLMQIASRFQSENIIQISALIRRMYAISNGVAGSWREFADHLAAFLASGFFTAVVSSITANVRGYEKDDSEHFDFWVNEFLWGNIVGGIPLINNFTGMIRFDSKKGLQTGFEPRQPLLTDIYNLVDIVSTMNEKNFARKGVQALEIAGNIYGVPIRNANRIISTTSRFIKNKTANDIQAFYSYKTKQQMFNQGVKDGNKQIISRYIKEEISNNAVREEMIRLALRNPDKKLNLYVGVTSFKKQNEDGVMVEHKIPIEIKGKYSELAQKTLRRLILQANYKKLDDAGKIVALQRVINYYNNYMKEVILNKNPKDLKAMLGMDAVIKNALKV